MLVRPVTFFAGAAGGPPAPTVYHRSLFNGTNGTQLPSYTPDIGGGWTSRDGYHFINTNSAKGNNQPSLSTVSPGVSDCRINMTFNLFFNPAIVFRYVDNNNRWTLNISNVNLELYNITGGSVASLDTAGLTVGAGDHTCAVEINGTSIKCWYDGVLKITKTSSVRQTAAIHGIRTYEANQSFIRDFEILGL